MMGMWNLEIDAPGDEGETLSSLNVKSFIYL